MNLQQINLGQLVSQIVAIILLVVSVGLALLLLGTTAKAFGHAIPFIPAMNETALAYLCGAFALYGYAKR